MFLRWHSWYAHVVFNFSLRQLANLSLQSIGLCRAQLGGKVASPMLCILVSQKLVLVKVVTVHIPIIGRWIIKDGGENWYNSNSMECDEQTTYVLCEWMALNATPYFPWIPLGYWRLGTMELSATSLFFRSLPMGRPVFFCSIGPCLPSLKDFGEICRTWLEYLYWKAISVSRICRCLLPSLLRDTLSSKVCR